MSLIKTTMGQSNVALVSDWTLDADVIFIDTIGIGI